VDISIAYEIYYTIKGASTALYIIDLKEFILNFRVSLASILRKA